MDLRTLIQSILISMLIVFPFTAKAATASAMISANIVPLTTFAVSSTALFSGSARHQAGKATIELTTSGADSPAKLSIHNGGNTTYDISVLIPLDQNDEYMSAIKIVDSKLIISKGGLTKNGARELDFGGAIEMMNIPDNASHTGYVYITSNFN